MEESCWNAIAGGIGRHPGNASEKCGADVMRRFGALMALDIRDPGDAAHVVALGKGAAGARLPAAGPLPALLA